MFLKPLFVALRGKSTGKVRWPSLRARAKSAPDARGSRAVAGAVIVGGRREAISTHGKSVMPKTVPMWLMVKFAFTQA